MIHEIKEEEKKEEESVEPSQQLTTVVINDRLSISVPSYFINHFSKNIMVLPVILSDYYAYEAVDAINHFVEQKEFSPIEEDVRLTNQAMLFDFELYNEIRNFFKDFLCDNLQQLTQEGREVELNVVATYAFGLRKVDPLFQAILQWCDETQLSITNYHSVPDQYDVEQLGPAVAAIAELIGPIDFRGLMKIPDAFQINLEPEEEQTITCCRPTGFCNFYTAPTLGFGASIYSLLAVSSPGAAFAYSSTIAFGGTVVLSLYRCNHLSALFVGALATGSAASVTALKYLMNTEQALITGAALSVGVPLAIYGVNRLKKSCSVSNRFSLWRAVPATPESREVPGANDSPSISSRSIELLAPAPHP